MQEGRAFIDDVSLAGSWRAALDDRAYCKGCGQSTCDCPDPVYAGIVPGSVIGLPRRDAGASGPAVPFHDMGDSRVGQ